MANSATPTARMSTGAATDRVIRRRRAVRDLGRNDISDASYGDPPGDGMGVDGLEVGDEGVGGLGGATAAASSWLRISGRPAYRPRAAASAWSRRSVSPSTV